jgi:lysozyme
MWPLAITTILMGVLGAILSRIAKAPVVESPDVAANAFDFDFSFMKILPAISASRLSPRGRQHIRDTEGLSLVPYADPPGQKKLYSIGYGYQLRKGEWWNKITKEFAEQLLEKVVAEDEREIETHISVPLNQNQYDAVFSWLYNIGAPNFRTSTLLDILNSGDYAGAAEQFKRWNKISTGQGLQVSNALVARRAKERDLFLS